VFARDFLLGAKGDLTARLDEVWRVLVATPQADPDALPPGMDNVASQLIHPSLAGAKGEVRVLSACCLVEVLRVYAPTPPYDHAQLRAIFDTLIAALEPLQGGSYGREAAYARSAHVLQSLAEVRTCCILAELAEDAPHAEDEQIARMFTVLLGGMTPEAPSVQEEHAADIMVAVLKELSAVSTATLLQLADALLARPKAPRAASLAAAVLRGSEGVVLVPLAQLLNHLVVLAASPSRTAASPEDGDGEEDEDARLAERYCRGTALQALVVEAAAALPALLLLVLPTLARDLEAEDVGVRRRTVNVMGALFALPPLVPPPAGSAAGPAPVGVAYETHYAAWARRFRDRDVGVRKDMCALGGEVLRAHRDLAPALCNELAGRLTDADDDVRQHAVIVACDCACAALPHVSAGLLAAAGARTRDRRLETRKEAATGLAQAYATGMAGVWQRSAAHAATVRASLLRSGSGSGGGLAPAGSVPLTVLSDADAEAVAKLRGLPSVVVACYEQADAELRQRVVQLVDYIMLSDKLPDDARAAALVGLWESLDAPATAALRHMLADRRATQTAMAAYLRARLEARTVGTGGGDTTAAAAARDALARAGAALADATGNRARGAAAVHALNAGVTDNRVLKLLAVLCEPGATADLAKAREDVQGRIKAAAANGGGSGVDWKVAGETLRVMVRRMTLATATTTMLPHLVAGAAQAAVAGDDAAAVTALQLLTTLTALFPGLWAGVRDDDSSGAAGLARALVPALIASRRAPVACAALHLLAAFPRPVFEATWPSDAVAAMRGTLLTLATSGSVRAAACATKAAAAVFEHTLRHPFWTGLLAALLPSGAAGRTDGDDDEDDFALSAPTTDSPLAAATPHAPALLAAAAALAVAAPAVFAAADGARGSRAYASAATPDAEAPGMAFGGRMSRPLYALAVSDPRDDDVVADGDGGEEEGGGGGRSGRGGRAAGGRAGNKRGRSGSPDARGGDAKRRSGEGVGDAVGSSCAAPRCGGVEDVAGPTPAYKGMAVRRPALLRLLAVKALGCIARGCATVVTSGGDGDGGDARQRLLSTARGVAAVASQLLAAGGDLHGTAMRVTSLRLGSVAAVGEDGGASALRSYAASAPRVGGEEEGAGGAGGLSDAEAAACRAAAGVALIRLAATRGGAAVCSKALPPAGFQLLARTLVDAVPAVRDAVGELLMRHLRTASLPLRYLALPMYAAVEPRLPVRRAMRERFARAVVAYRAAAAAATAAGLPPHAFTPEYATCFAVYLLAHDDARFPSAVAAAAVLRARAGGGGGSALAGGDDGDSPARGAAAGGGAAAAGKDDWGALTEQAACLSVLADALLSNAGGAGGAGGGGGEAGGAGSATTAAAAAAPSAAGSLSLLFAMLRQLRACDDAAVVPATAQLHAAADCAFFVFKRHAKDAAAWAPFPGVIALPTALYRARMSSRVGGGGGGGGSSSASTAGGGGSVSTAAALPRARARVPDSAARVRAGGMDSVGSAVGSAASWAAASSVAGAASSVSTAGAASEASAVAAAAAAAAASGKTGVRRTGAALAPTADNSVSARGGSKRAAAAAAAAALATAPSDDEDSGAASASAEVGGSRRARSGGRRRA